MGIFGKGYVSVREEKKRQDENRERAKSVLWRFYLTADDSGGIAEADVRFLTEEPITFMEHTVKTFTSGGKESYDSVLCTNEGCALRADGDKPSFKGAYLIWDKRPFEYKDKNGEKKVNNKGQLRLYVQGTRVLSQLDRISEKYGLVNREITIVRMGRGTATTYTIEKGDRVSPLSKEEISNLLPESLRPLYNGTEESLYQIVEKCLSAEVGAASQDSSEVDESSGSKNLVNIEETSSQDSSAPRKLAKKSALKPKENSVKSLFKSK